MIRFLTKGSTLSQTTARDLGRVAWIACVLASTQFAAAAPIEGRGVGSPTGAPAPKVSPSATHQIDALRSIKRSKTALQAKIDSRLYLGLLHARHDARLALLKDFRFVKPDADGRFSVEVVVKTATGLAPVSARVAALGGVVQGVSHEHRMVNARVGLDDLERLAALPDVRRVRQPVPATTQGLTVSEGDTTHGASTARSFYGFDGTGVKVCVISDGVDALVSQQSSGELPANVDVLQGQDGSGQEGSALLEIIHDVAPGATLGFATGTFSEASFAQNILDLAAANCTVIMDDVTYADESPFQDGPVAQAVNTVTAAGVLYFAPAGNEGGIRHQTSSTWEGDFTASAAADPGPLAGANLADFGDGGNSILVTQSSGQAPLLIWAESYDLNSGAASTDYDIYDMNGSLTTIFDASTDVQDGVGGDDFPIEFIGGGAFSGERLLIDKFASGTTSSVPMMHLVLLHGQTTWSGAGGLDPALATTGGVRGHGAAALAFSVAATPADLAFANATAVGPYPDLFSVANETEGFSSDGPRRIILTPSGVEITPGNRTATGGVVRQKPDVTAADGVSTTVEGFASFYGTSAAAAHAAAIAALLKSAVPGATAAQIRTALTSSALDIEAVGIDPASGAGIIMAQAALEALGAQPATQLALTSTPNPSIYGVAVNFTADVLPANATGTITFFDGQIVMGTVALAGGVATIGFLPLAAGTHLFSASYGGDADNSAASSSVLSQVVEKGPSTVRLVSAANPSSFGSSLTLLASLSPPAASGTVSFKDGNTLLGTATIVSATASLAISNLAIGSHRIVAEYGGDVNVTGSVSTGLYQAVNPIDTQITLASSLNPSSFGAPVDFTAQVEADALGTMTFRDNGVPVGVIGVEGGNATLTLSALSVGTHSITVQYSGDGAHDFAASFAVAQVVGKADSSTTLVSSLNPSTADAPVTFSATVAPSTATGTVTFLDGTHPIGTGDVNGGVATLAVPGLLVGSHSITAAYAGNDRFNASATDAVDQEVTATPLLATTTTLTAAPEAPVFGASITFTATVAPETATGNVVFQEGDTILTTAVVANGTATFTSSALSGGSHTLTATYGGDSAFAASSSAALVQTVGGAATAATLVSSQNPASVGAAIVFTATVTSAAGMPTGTVAVLEGTTIVTTAPLASGTATLSAHLTAGTHALRLGYPGDENFAASASTAVSQVVTAVASTADAGTVSGPDAGSAAPDARPGVDAGTSAGSPDAGASTSSSDGGGCTVGGSTGASAMWFVLVVLFGLTVASRRRRQRQDGASIAR